MAKMPLYPLFQDIRSSFSPIRAQAAVNLHLETEHHFIEVHMFNYERLVITFEDARPPMVRPDRYRMGWGVDPFLKRGVSVMAIKPKVCDWYSRPELAGTLVEMKPFLARFGEILHYGMSMGGFGALAYADLTGARRVVALSPQTTYKTIEGKRDPRYPDMLRWTFDHPHDDAALGCKTPADVWVLSDRYELWDKWHVARLTGANVHRVGLPFFAHGVAMMLKNVGALSMVVDLVLTGTLDYTALYLAARRRREFTTYLNFLKVKANRHPSVQARLQRILMEDAGPSGTDSTIGIRKNDGFAS